MPVNNNQIFFIKRRPLVFYLCEPGEGIRFAIEPEESIINTRPDISTQPNLSKITKIEAYAILARELHRFAHKRSTVTVEDIKEFIKDLDTKRNERCWRKFYRREHRAVDSLIRGMAIKPTWLA
ncbi:hypothetical protein L486_01125 [Kwoniella mangroviensis CBS 10435]|uniref:Uncharacterized protein n=1 Tax=Kwoniella mangroviensis CBS 10435 TaxID=1331196 RepID=A0A1B9J113_9TREE|nr:uncharacterized protein I203_05947 [Kwoniella mangroviensis CBS 8507]OCF61477.1 hypothetical protein L486_01125 [Kwoniella mangroviensis CBS 10435]OCF64703.1 hypothetical protein I203_05947 [Kwoniella mangroviensis CBS 8507]OCF77497.1 hypothetical protein I204_01485 [Kwoniella mangroviensis CBS 8886]